MGLWLHAYWKALDLSKSWFPEEQKGFKDRKRKKRKERETSWCPSLVENKVKYVDSPELSTVLVQQHWLGISSLPACFWLGTAVATTEHWERREPHWKSLLCKREPNSKLSSYHNFHFYTTAKLKRKSEHWEPVAICRGVLLWLNGWVDKWVSLQKDCLLLSRVLWFRNS